MMNIYLTDSDEEATVDFVKDYEEPTSTLRTRPSRNAFGRGLPGKLTQFKSGQAPKEMTEN